MCEKIFQFAELCDNSQGLKIDKIDKQRRVSSNFGFRANNYNTNNCEKYANKNNKIKVKPYSSDVPLHKT